MNFDAVEPWNYFHKEGHRKNLNAAVIPKTSVLKKNENSISNSYSNANSGFYVE